MTAQAAATVQDSTSAAPAAEVPEAVEQAFTRVQNGADIRGVVLEGVSLFTFIAESVKLCLEACPRKVLQCCASRAHAKTRMIQSDCLHPRCQTVTLQNDCLTHGFGTHGLHPLSVRLAGQSVGVLCRCEGREHQPDTPHGVLHRCSVRRMARARQWQGRDRHARVGRHRFAAL